MDDECKSQEKIQCPYCIKDNLYLWDWESEVDEKIECEHCGREFQAIGTTYEETVISFDTEEIE
tara:strand:+ start:185 stop:376 length:192 start_codon:yes stop_codon:yes gene_type:complete